MKEKTKLLLNALCVSKSVAQKNDLAIEELWPHLRELIEKWLPAIGKKAADIHRSPSQLLLSQQLVCFHSLFHFSHQMHENKTGLSLFFVKGGE
jgi:hypothetical protein